MASGVQYPVRSPPALEACTSVEVDLDARDGAKPSDHAPLLATLG